MTWNDICLVPLLHGDETNVGCGSRVPIKQTCCCCLPGNLPVDAAIYIKSTIGPQIGDHCQPTMAACQKVGNNSTIYCPLSTNRCWPSATIIPQDSWVTLCQWKPCFQPQCINHYKPCKGSTVTLTLIYEPSFTIYNHIRPFINLYLFPIKHITHLLKHLDAQDSHRLQGCSPLSTRIVHRIPNNSSTLLGSSPSCGALGNVQRLGGPTGRCPAASDQAVACTTSCCRSRLKNPWNQDSTK